jgi:hypothetical protein
MSYAKKSGQLASYLTSLQYWDTIKITFINEINPDSRLLLIRMEVPNTNLSLNPHAGSAQLTQSNLKLVYTNRCCYKR